MGCSLYRLGSLPTAGTAGGPGAAAQTRGLTVSSVELGVVGGVGARGLGGALEGRVREHGHQGAVAVIYEIKAETELGKRTHVGLQSAEG